MIRESWLQPIELVLLHKKIQSLAGFPALESLLGLTRTPCDHDQKCLEIVGVFLQYDRLVDR
jgi:hypothetical protein